MRFRSVFGTIFEIVLKGDGTLLGGQQEGQLSREHHLTCLLAPRGRRIYCSRFGMVVLEKLSERQTALEYYSCFSSSGVPNRNLCGSLRSKKGSALFAVLRDASEYRIKQIIIVSRSTRRPNSQKIILAEAARTNTEENSSENVSPKTEGPNIFIVSLSIAST